MLNRYKLKKKFDIAILILLPIVTFIISITVKANFITSTLLFFGLPAIWLSLTNNQAIKKTLVFSLIFFIPLTIIIDYLMVINNVWFITESIFPFRLLNIIALEQFIWSFLWIYLIVIFYESFFDKKNKFSIFKKERLIKKEMKWFELGLIVAILILISITLFSEYVIAIPYAYLTIGIVLVLLPLILFLSFYPNLITRFVKITLYFAFLAILIEITGIYLNHWIFPSSEFIGYLSVLNFSIPLEEFFFYFIISTASILSYYEFFNDDKK